ncbi:RlpA-like double-psi beta-barrel-protein domain-containing protein-containing protein [Scleroderma yunnanense]
MHTLISRQLCCTATQLSQSACASRQADVSAYKMRTKICCSNGICPSSCPPTFPLLYPARIKPLSLFMMYRFTTLLIVLSALLLSTFAAPLAVDASVLAKRTHVGRGTWYHPGYGACGQTNGDNDAVAAMSVQSFSTSNCGQWVYITNTANGQSTSAQIVDSCESCDTNSLDMSPGVFGKLADLSVGVIQIQWG